MHLAPRRVVAHAHLGRSQRAALIRLARIVLDGAAHQHRVRDGDFLVAHGDQFGGQRAHLLHHPFVLPDHHIVADPQGARVHQHQTAHQLVDHTRRAQREHGSQQHRHAPEHVAVGAGQIGVDSHHGQRPDAKRRQPPRGRSRLRVDGRDAQLPLGNSPEHGVGRFHCGLRQQQDHNDHHQPRDSLGEAIHHQGCRLVKNSPQPQAQGPRGREREQHRGQPRKHQPSAGKQRCELDQPRQHGLAIVRPGARRTSPGVAQFRQTVQHHIGQAPQAPQRQTKQQGLHNGQTNAFHQHRPAVLLLQGFQRLG